MADSVLSKSSKLYATVTEKIILAIEAGVEAGTGKMPWHSMGAPVALPINAVTGQAYRGGNVLALWVSALVRKYSSGMWATYKQWQDIGAQVRKGEQGTVIVFYKQLELSPLEDQDPDQRIERRYFGQAAWVFNEAQVDGYVPPEPESPLCETDRCIQAEALLETVGAKIEEGYQFACYNPASDVIQMPSWEWFTGTDTSSPVQSYYAVRFHETVHWTGAHHRLKREFGKRFGDQAYALEELVAEIGAAFLCAEFGIASEPRPDHAQYIANWLTVLKHDGRAMFIAASAAQEAFEYLIYLATRNEPESHGETPARVS
jgi:antirestriction protein ArdC